MPDARRQYGAMIESSTALKIDIIGINYAPEHSGIAPYTTDAAEHLAQQGHQVRMWTGVDHYPHWTVPPHARWRRSTQDVQNGVEVTRLRHYVPRRQSALRRLTYEVTFGAHVATAAARSAPDVILAVVPSLMGALVATRLADRANVPLITWVQDLMGQAAAQSGIAGGGA